MIDGSWKRESLAVSSIDIIVFLDDSTPNRALIIHTPMIAKSRGS